MPKTTKNFTDVTLAPIEESLESNKVLKESFRYTEGTQYLSNYTFRLLSSYLAHKPGISEEIKKNPFPLSSDLTGAFIVDIYEKLGFKLSTIRGLIFRGIGRLHIERSLKNPFSDEVWYQEVKGTFSALERKYGEEFPVKKEKVPLLSEIVNYFLLLFQQI